jgi:hypothetical protein
MSRYKLTKSEHDNGSKFEKLPTGEYVFQITDFKETDKQGNDLVTKAGDPKISLTLEVITPEEYAGRKVFHNLNFYLPTSPSIKGIGMTRHFLHCCNLPYEGDLDTDPNEFIGAKVRATVVHNGDYVNLDNVMLDESLFGNKAVAKVDAPVTVESLEWSE